MKKKTKDGIFLAYQILIAAVGLVAVIVKKNTWLFWVYIAFMACSILACYFNYLFCRWGNRWHALRYEKNPCDGEPSLRMLAWSKVGCWFLYIIALIFALIPALPA